MNQKKKPENKNELNKRRFLGTFQLEIPPTTILLSNPKKKRLCNTRWVLMYLEITKLNRFDLKTQEIDEFL